MRILLNPTISNFLRNPIILFFLKPFLEFFAYKEWGVSLLFLGFAYKNAKKMRKLTKNKKEILMEITNLKNKTTVTKTTLI